MIELTINKEKLGQGLDVLMQGAQACIAGQGSILKLLGAWFLSLFLPVTFLALGCFFGLLTDKVLGFKSGTGPFTFVGTALPGLVIASLYAGWIKTCLDVADKSPTRMQLIQPMQTIISCAIVLVLSTSAVVVGGLFLVLPGAFMWVKTQFAPYYVVDRGVGPMDALKLSWVATDKVFIQLAVIDLVFFAISSVSGPTVVVPFLCYIAQTVTFALAYRMLAEPVDGDESDQYEDDD